LAYFAGSDSLAGTTTM